MNTTRQACQRQEKRTPCRTAEKLHTTLPCPFRNGKGTANRQPKTTANGKPEIRHADMADSAGAGRRGVRHRQNVPYQKLGRRCSLPVRQIKRQPFATSYTRPLRRSYGGERVSLSERI